MPGSFSEFMHMLVSNLLSGPFSGLFSFLFWMLLNRPLGFPGTWFLGRLDSRKWTSPKLKIAKNMLLSLLSHFVTKSYLLQIKPTCPITLPPHERASLSSPEIQKYTDRHPVVQKCPLLLKWPVDQLTLFSVTRKERYGKTKRKQCPPPALFILDQGNLVCKVVLQTIQNKIVDEEATIFIQGLLLLLEPKWPHMTSFVLS